MNIKTNDNLNKSNDILIQTLVSQVECRDILLKQSKRDLEISKIKSKEESKKHKKIIMILTLLFIISLVINIVLLLK